MKRYEKYKPSGVEWLGDVPNEWIVSKLLYCLRKPICDGPHETPAQVEDGIPFISIDSLNDSKSIDFSVVTKFISEEDYRNYMKKAKLEKGDILFSKAATIGKTAIVGDEKFMVWSPLAILKNNPQKLNNDFLYYLVNCQKLITSIALSGSYNTQINVGMREMEKAIIPLPPPEEQTAIADYLDAKCSKIDNVVEVQRKRIELLKELKQSIITHAVTKGLNKNVKMKDSGVDWIGEVPVNWKEDKLRYIGKYRKGPFGSALKVSLFVPKNSDTIKVYEQQNAIEKDWELGEYYITKDYFNRELSAFEVFPRDIIVSCAGTIGECYLMPENIERGIINQALMRMRMNEKKVYIPYFLFLFDLLLKEESKRSSNGSAMKNIPPFDVLKAMRIFLPTIPEQTAIADYLDKKCATIDGQIAKVEKQIELLNEYKQSVITECVTGKRKVC